MQKRERIYSLDVLKILGTVIVVFHHYQQYMEVKFPNGVNYFFGQFFFGYVVELFFLLSGFFAWHYVKKSRMAFLFDNFLEKHGSVLRRFWYWEHLPPACCTLCIRSSSMRLLWIPQLVCGIF